MSRNPTSAEKLTANVKDQFEMGYLLDNGWVHNGLDQWFAPCEESDGSFSRLDAVRSQRVIDSGIIIDRENLHRVPY